MDKSLQRAIGANIRQQREILGLSQEEFAARLGYHRTYVGSIEQGRRNLSLQTVEKLARQLDVQPLELLTFLDAGTTPPPRATHHAHDEAWFEVLGLSEEEIAEVRRAQQIHGAGNYFYPTSPTYIEHFRVPHLSLGTYSLPAGSVDGQDAHSEDEVYICTTGQAVLWTQRGEVEMGPGAVAYVPAGEEHRFIEIEDDLAVLVVFGPAESDRHR